MPCLVPLRGLGGKIRLPFALLQMLGGCLFILFQNPSIRSLRSDVCSCFKVPRCFSILLIVGFIQSGVTVSNPLRFTYSISCLGADTNDKGATLQQTDPSCSTPRQSRLTRTTLENDSWLNLLTCIAFSAAKVSFLCWRGWTLTLS